MISYHNCGAGSFEGVGSSGIWDLGIELVLGLVIILLITLVGFTKDQAHITRCMFLTERGKLSYYLILVQRRNAGQEK